MDDQARHAEACDLPLDPRSTSRINVGASLPWGAIGFPNEIVSGPRPLAEDALGPELARVVGDRQDRHAELDRKSRTAGLVLARGPALIRVPSG